MDEYRKNVLSKKSVYSQWRSDYIIPNHILPWFGEMRVSEIGDKAVSRYFQANNPAPASTLEKELRVLKNIIHLAKQDGEPSIHMYFCMDAIQTIPSDGGHKTDTN